MGSAQEEFREGNEAIKHTQIQTGSAQKRSDASVQRLTVEGPVVAQSAELFGEPHPPRNVPDAGTRSSVVIKRADGAARIEIHIVKHSRDFELGRDSSRRRVVLRLGSTREGLRARSVRKREKISR